MQHIDAAERATVRVQTGNWQRMLPVIVAARGLVKPSLPGAIEREFCTGDPAIVRAAVVDLLQRVRIQAQELHTENLSYLTLFVAIQATP